MKCISPVTIRNPAVEKFYDHGLEEAPMQYIQVPCGKCYACLAKKRKDWCMRLEQERKQAISAYFITLTYQDIMADVNEKGYLCVCKDTVQKWIKRLRKYVETYSESDIQLRYFLVSEYGTDTHRPHYHVILFNFPPDLDIYTAIFKTWRRVPSKSFIGIEEVCDSFGAVLLGIFDIGDVTSASINYVCKYTLSKTKVPEGCTPNFMLCSRRPAIGRNFLENEKMVEYLKRRCDGCYNDHGVIRALPRYYKDNIFDEDEKSRVSEIMREYILNADKAFEEKYKTLDISSKELIRLTMIDDYNRRMSNIVNKGKL